MTIEPGQNLLHYRILGKLGEGGMGQVWEAVDTTLDRDVAIKVLPEAFSTDAERLARFEREARLLAALNHPNIAAVYGLHEEAGARFLVMERVSGEDLDQRLKRGPLSEPVALTVAGQIATALETAHAAGIIHRDLKPANVVIDADNNVKVLDFGLAKALDGEATDPGADPAMSPTITSMGTVAGMIMGTAAYMSPEQARGRDVDNRGDIWSFGCLLYEVLCGRMAFRGETVSDTLAAVLAKEPQWDALEQHASPPLQDLVRRCLRKDTHTRIQSIGDARIAIEEIATGDREVEAPPSRTGISSRMAFLMVASAMVLTVLVMFGMFGMFGIRPASDSAPSLRKFEVPVTAEISSSTGQHIRLSPDGRRIAYVSGNRLWVREFDRIRPREIPGTTGATTPFWSPDSGAFGFQNAGRLYRMSLHDDEPVVICPLPGTSSGAVWLDDGRILFNIIRGPLMAVAAGGGLPVEVLAVTDGLIDFHQPNVLPDGKTLLFSVHREEGVDTLAALADGELKTLLQIPGQVRSTPQVVNNPVWSPTGHILFERNQGLVGIWALPFSAETLKATGEPFLVVPDAYSPTVSDDGLFAYTVARDLGPRQLTVVDRSGAIVRTIGEPRVGLSAPAVSPDGSRIVATIEETGSANLWVFDVETGQSYRLVDSSGDDDQAQWSPDGTRIAYSCEAEGGMSTCVMSMIDETVKHTIPLSGNPVWTPDGQSLVVRTLGRADRGLLTVDLTSGADPEPWLVGTSDIVEQRVSSNGNRISFWVGDTASPGYYVTTFPEETSLRQIAGSESREARWSPKNEELYLIESNAMKVVRMRGPSGLAMDPLQTLFELPREFETQFSVMPSGDQFLVARSVGGEQPKPSYFVVENWIQEFEDPAR